MTKPRRRKNNLLDIFKFELVVLILPMLQRSFVVGSLLLGIVQGLLQFHLNIGGVMRRDMLL